MTPTEEQQQPNDAPADEPAPVQYEAWRVRVVSGSYPLQFTKGKLWPQGEKQTIYAQMSWEYSLLISQLAEHQHLAGSEQYKKAAADAKSLRSKMEAMATTEFKNEDPPLEAIVREIHELNGNVYVIGAAFGALDYAPIEDLPKSACIVSRRITQEAFEEFVLPLRQLAALEASLVSVEEEEDEEEEEEVDEETDEDEEVEETTADVIVEAALALVSSATTIEARPEGPVVVVPAAAWEPLSAAITSHLTALNGDPEEDEQGEESSGVEPDAESTGGVQT